MIVIHTSGNMLMKKMFILVIASVFSMGAWAGTQYKATTECQFDYDDFDFCSTLNISKYKSALSTQKANFDSKYILLNIGNPKAIRYVAIDTKNGWVLPLRDTILGFKDLQGGLTGKPPVISYSINNAHLCIKGSIDAYRDAYDNVEVCYAIQENQYSKYKKEFSRKGSPESLD